MFRNIILFYCLINSLSFNSQVWLNLGTGINTEVQCLYSDPESNLLFAGGEFTVAGGVPANRIAKWDGSNWSPVGAIHSNSGAVNAIISWNGDLYAAGWGLRPQSSQNYSNLLRYNGVDWSHVDLQLTGNTEIYALAVYQNELIIALDNDPSMITDNMPGFLRFNGVAVSELGNSPIGTGKVLLAQDGYLYASGKYVYRWNGIDWSVLHSDPYCPLESCKALAYYRGTLIAAANPTYACGGSGGFSDNIWWYNEFIGRWEKMKSFNCGTSGVSANGNTKVNALQVYRDELYVAGDLDYVYDGLDGLGSNCDYVLASTGNIAKWTGYNFMPLSPGLNYPANCLATFNDQLVMGGLFTTANGVPANHISLHEAPQVSRIEFYNSVKNGTFLEKPYFLGFSQSNDINGYTLKACADGTKSTVIKFFTPGVDPHTIRFRIKGDYFGLNPNEAGKFEEADYLTSGDTVIVKLTHPTHMADTGVCRHDTIQVYENVGNVALFECPAAFYKAPVLLVHGLWSNGDFWRSFEEELHQNNFIPELTHRISYEGTNANYFYDNIKYIPWGIRTAVVKARMAKISCGAVDLIGHSMGGILSRLYLQSVFYKNDVHKLLTVNTPHAGSQAANLLKNPIIGSSLSEAATFVGNNCFDGAVDDLQVGSWMVDNILNGSEMNNALVPTHTFSTYTTLIQSVIAVPDWVVVMIRLGAIASTKIFPNPYAEVAVFIMEFPDLLFTGQNNDLVVSEPSQIGGCSHSTSNHPYWHSTWKNYNQGLYASIINVLTRSGNDASYYSMSGFNPPVQSSLFKSNPDIQPFQNSGNVSVTNLNNGDTITANQNFQFNLSAAGDVQRIMVVISGGTDNMYFFDTTASATFVNFHLENSLFEWVKVLVVGYDTTGILDMDTLNVFVKDTIGYQCNSISVYPGLLVLQTGEIGEIDVNANCDLGERRVSLSQNCLFNPVNGTIVSNPNLNKFQGNVPGFTSVSVDYFGLKDTVLVIVLDSTVGDVVLSVQEKEIVRPDESFQAKVKIFPNPVKGEMVLLIDFSVLLDNLNLTVMNVLGQEVFTLNNLNSRQVKINCENYKSGLYFYQLSCDGETISTGKFIKE